MKGSLKERSPGRWAIILDAHDPVTGKRKRRWHSFAGTKRQAQIRCAELISAIQNGTDIEPNKITVAAFLERWLTHAKSQVAPRTHERYAEIVRTCLVPSLGKTALAKLQPMAISRAYGEMLATGRRKGAGGLSPRTVQLIHRIFKHALGQAVRGQMLSRNPAELVNAPRVERAEMKVWDVPTMAAALEQARHLRIFIPALLAGMCGLRRGEIAALRWRNVDLERAQLSVTESAELTQGGVRLKPPKSGRGRNIALPAKVVEEVGAWRTRQAQELLRLGIRIDKEVFVCGREDGGVIQPPSLTDAWDRFVSTAKLPRIRFHYLRHSHATHLLASGVHPKIASERLGHATVGLTLDTYSHVLPGMQADAVFKIDAAFAAVANKPK